MKKLALIFLSAFLIAWYSPFVAMQDGSELVCTSYLASTSGTDTVYVAQYNTGEYRGVVFDDANSGSICRVDLTLGGKQGDISGLDYYVEVWLLDAGLDLVTNVGRSDKVDGNNSWDYSLVPFNFTTSAPYDCTTSDQKYAIFVKAIANDAAASTAGAFSETNYCFMYMNDEANAVSHLEGVGLWADTTNVLTSVDVEDDLRFTVYTEQ